MKKQVNPVLAAVVILAAVAVALFVMFQKSQLPPPMVGEEMRQRRGFQYEVRQSLESEDIGPASEDRPAAPEAPPAEDAE